MDRTSKHQKGAGEVGQRIGRRAMMAALGTTALAAAGCQPIVGLIVLSKGFKTIPPQFAGLKGERVVVVCQADVPIQLNFSNIDTDLGTYISRKFRLEKIKAVNSDEVAEWLGSNTEAKTAKAIGEHFDAEFVVMIRLNSYTLYEENSPTLYRGQATARIEAYDMEKDGERVFETDHDAKYPIGRPIPIDEMRPEAFQREFLKTLANELGRYFYDHEPGEDVDSF